MLLYWHAVRMWYRLSDAYIGHAEPSVKERWEWVFDKMNTCENKTNLPLMCAFLEQELFDEGIAIPLF